MRQFLPLLFACSFFMGCTQKETVTVRTGSFQEYKNGWSGIEYLSMLTGNEVVSHQGKKYKIKKPRSWNHIPLAWGSNYFPGNRNMITGKDIFFLVAAFDSSVCKIVFDTNGNADFNDDTIKTVRPGTPFVITYKSNTDKDAFFLNRFQFSNKHNASPDSAYKTSVKYLYAPLPTQYFLQVNRLNCRKAVLADNNVVTLWDYNGNGIFNEQEDKVVAGDVAFENGYELSKNPIRTKRPGSDGLLPFQNNTYRLVSVDKYGRSVELEAMNKIIDTTEKLPLFLFYDVNDGKHSFRPDSTKAYTIVYIWGNWSLDCHYQTPEVARLKKNYGVLADVSTFNYGDKKEMMLNYIQKNNLAFKPDYIDAASLEKLNVDGFPAFLVVDKTKTVVLRTTAVDEVESFLKNKAR